MGSSSKLRARGVARGARAECFLRRPLAGEEQEPRVVITDQRASNVPALKRVLPTAEHLRIAATSA